ncbi:glycosyltransferase WbuB [Cupriavidus respiraculi]|uniref:D-inositol-3-phosphate glycosyltransferase n=1 Tax=Cupriavidus respiraculi TaxID=195930 RepID=A0ABN7YBU6_9BURK|nr:glycosyltransferase WbuB [Cupriavidus respiraculi]CAG9169332.1 D-inositol-3-phosphate glycosyltransferase [Cupriavidus respiraculi]
MKILLYCLNYSPELTGIGKYTGEQAEWLAARGHDVRVITAPPYYPAWRIGAGFRAWQYRRESRGGVHVARAPLWVPRRPSGLKRLVHLASFAASSLPLLFAQWRWRPDVLFVVEPPLFCSPAALLFGRLSGCKTWLHVQDYEVDAAFALGLLRQPLLRRLATALERAAMTRFDCVSTISEAMLRLAREKGADAARTLLLPNWVDVQGLRPSRGSLHRRRLGIPADAVLALYSGNMGNKQGLDVLADAARRLAHRPDIHFVFCGDGAGRAELEAACAGLAQVHFLPLQSAQRFPALLCAADIHLLPQRADAADLVLPSKLTGMLASGRAVVATAHAATELGRLLASCGVIVPPGDGGALADAIGALARDPDRRAELGAAGRAWAERHLDREAVLARLEQQLLALCGTPAPRPVPAIGVPGE